MYAGVQPGPGRSPDDEVLRRLPLDLRTRTGGTGDGGPGLPDALYWLHRIELLCGEAERLGRQHRGPGPGGAEAELCGRGAKHAAAVLAGAVREAVSRTAPSDRPQPQESRIDWEAWVHATCSMRAEWAICEERATETGAAAAAFLRVADQACTVFRSMAGVEAFTWWRTLTDPLYRAWLDGALSHIGAPPALFPDRDALYRARPALAAGWEPDAQLSPDDVFPLGSLERYVPDGTGTWWAIIIVTPQGADDPRAWPHPTAAVVASSVPGGTAPSCCYLLAERVIPRQVLPALGAGRAEDRLEDIAVCLASRTGG
ncbi:hypothetical protein ACIPYS_35000 [Kitasatospora sp. NPDC089913]|uniref:hypothetical protein n=1 Tax=Streptomycetaceae TaxID=2062 RepID=UPI00087CA3BC|nr:hypothetical protein [Streptomyces sp. TLI_053]SDT82976.1 hypothetical protein SAMN05216371_7788 [Streptomyces sp. TLI_053]